MRKLRLVLFLIPSVLFAQENEVPGYLLIKPEWVFRGDSDRLEEGFHILCRGDRIDRIGREIDPPEGAEEIDAPGMCAMPGLIDAHVQLFDGFLAGPVYLYPAWGVTTVRDFENHILRIKGLREVIDSGEIMGPRIVYAGEALTGEEASAPFRFPLSGPEAARKKVRSLAEEGAGFILLASGIKEETARAAVDESSSLDLRVASDLLLSESLDARGAVRLGVKCIERLGGVPQALAKERIPHECRLFDWLNLDGGQEKELIDEIVERGVFLVPTLGAFEKMYLPAELVLEENDGTRGLARETLESWRELTSRRDESPWWAASRQLHFQNSRRFIGRAARAGAKIVAGSGAPAPGVPPGAGLLRELELLREAGLTPAAALRAAMIEAARCIGREADLGSLHEGKYADILIVEGNPLSDLAATRRIRWVIKGGKILNREEIPGFGR